jgi:hypothetical protein
MSPNLAVALCKVAFWLLVLGFLVLIVGCATDGPAARGPEHRVGTNEVSIPKATKCFEPESVPALPGVTRVPEGATTDQLAAAAAADREALRRYAVQADKLWSQCTKGTQ